MTIALTLIATLAVLVALVLAHRLRHAQLVSRVAIGDEITTTGGLLGRVSGYDGENLWLEVDHDCQVRITRHSVSAIAPTDPTTMEPTETEDT